MSRFVESVDFVKKRRENRECVLGQGYTTTQHPCIYESYSYIYNAYSLKYKYCSSYQYCCGTYTYRYCCYDYTNYYSSYVYSYISHTISAAAIAGIVIGVLFAAAIIISIIVCICCAVRKRPARGGVVYQNNTPAVAVVHSQAQPGVAYPTQPYVMSPQNYPYPPPPAQPYQPPVGVATSHPPPYQPQGGVTNTAYTADHGSAPENKASAPPAYVPPTQQYETISNQRRDDNVYDELQ